MIHYRSGRRDYYAKFFALHGSVFPYAFVVALPCAMMAGIVRILITDGYLPYLEEEGDVLLDSQAWSGFSFLLGFLIVFRTSQSYSRFWEGLHCVYRMQAELFDSAAALVAFTSTSNASPEEVLRFRHVIIRLLSMLNAAALGHLENKNEDDEKLKEATFSYELFDPASLDAETRKCIKNTDHRVELIFTWVQTAIVQNHEAGILNVPPPILSRTFQTLSNGMIAFHDAAKIAGTPFPFPYAQTCDLLLGLYCLISPFTFSQFSLSAFWAFTFCFVQIFVYSALNLTAVEIENPFGTDANDIDGHSLQQEVNSQLMYLLNADVCRTPNLSNSILSELGSSGFSRQLSSSVDRDALVKRTASREPLAPQRVSSVAGIASGSLRSFGSLGIVPSERSQGVQPSIASEDSIWKKGHGEILNARVRWEHFDTAEMGLTHGWCGLDGSHRLTHGGSSVDSAPDLLGVTPDSQRDEPDLGHVQLPQGSSNPRGAATPRDNRDGVQARPPPGSCESRDAGGCIDRRAEAAAGDDQGEGETI